MFKVKIGEDEYEVKFYHCVPSSVDRENIYFNNPILFRETFGTLCSLEKILPDGSREGILSAWSELSLRDNFDRNVGRKVSLSKLLYRCRSKFLGGLTAEDRKLFWDAYYKARGGKW